MNKIEVQIHVDVMDNTVEKIEENIVVETANLIYDKCIENNIPIIKLPYIDIYIYIYHHMNIKKIIIILKIKY